MKRNLIALSIAASAGIVVGAAMFSSDAFSRASAQPAAATVPASTTWGPAGKRERFTPENSVMVFVDHQTGLMNLVDNVDATNFKNYVVGLGKLAKLHNMPVVITTSAEDGPNGPKIPEIVSLFPNTPIIARPGQINAWDNADFVKAIEATGRKKLIVSGITTDVCVAFVTLSALDAGYEVYVVADASGTMSQQVQEVSLLRMSEAGAIMGNWFAIACELLNDWRNPAGAGSAQLFIEHLPSYAEIVSSHSAAQNAKK